ncbi:hypothetical protein I3760_10G143300 [Carya illinoinensis]|nr:hypothetical protein I3760_10G143300 [Carya illinoinensis]
MYLEVPLVTGHLTARLLEPLVNKILNKVAGWKVKTLSQAGRLTLIQHVLSCMATHLLAVLNVPQILLSKLNSILSTFFWGTHHGKPKRKWVSWSSICKPIYEGGLGFFRAKYARDENLVMAASKETGSRLWKAMMQVFLEVQENTRVRIKEGNVSFWHVKWLLSGPLSVQVQDIVNPMVRVKDLWIGNVWDENALIDLVSENRAREIMQSVMARKEGFDVYIWESNRNDIFTTTLAWNITRVRSEELPWKGWLWHNLLPRRVVVCVWEAWFRSLPVDMRITDMGVALASRCDCCARGSLEMLDHVLCSGDVAKAVWEKATVTLGVRCMGFSSWRARVSAWFSCAKRSSQREILVGLIPSLITWRLWLRRCKARMESMYESLEAIWISVKFWLSQISENITKCNRLSATDNNLLAILNVPIKQIINRNIRVVKWLKPKSGWVKLNVDGSCRGNLGTCGGGGVIRDHQGKVKAAFSKIFGFGTNNVADLRALS